MANNTKIKHKKGDLSTYRKTFMNDNYFYQ